MIILVTVVFSEVLFFFRFVGRSGEILSRSGACRFYIRVLAVFIIRYVVLVCRDRIVFFK